MFVGTVLQKIKETWLTFFQGSVTILLKMANSQEARVELTNTQLNKLKSTSKNETRTILRLNTNTFWRWRITT